MNLLTLTSVVANFIWAIAVFFAVPIVLPVSFVLGITLIVLGLVCSLQVIFTLLNTYLK